MKGKKLKLSLLCVVLLFLGFSVAAFGDWDKGDPYKMHYPQLPNPIGWDVAFRSPSPPQQLELADDWQCTATGPVSDIHFWISWQNGTVGSLSSIRVCIYSNNPLGPSGGSEPNLVLYDRVFSAGQYTVRQYGTGEQGWYNPYSGVWNKPDHNDYYQINITDINEPFIQQEGTIYWLGIRVAPPTGGTAGWKTALPPVFMDTAVWRRAPAMTAWMPLYDPMEPMPLDLAFVITGQEEEPNQPTIKYVQEPDLSETGIDVDATYDISGGLWPPQLLADDFPCTTTGPITDIHIWSSWYHDYLPYGDPCNVEFVLSIHDNIPADPCNPRSYSMPGELLWSKYFGRGEYEVSVEANGLMEGYYVPCTQYYEYPGDSICWRYDFNISRLEAFRQQGDPCNPVIYWLDVQATVDSMGLPIRFGWKTSTEHWMDDAVFAVGYEGNHEPWQELRYPYGHPFEGNSIDLAFAITTYKPKPPVPHLKWSQPPVEMDPYSTVPTYCGWDELSHLIEPGLWKVVADDFRCLGTMPVTSIHWWGSYYGWEGSEPPQPEPIAWRIGFWSNMPAGMIAPYSYPQELLWQVVVPADRVDVNNVGRDYFPETPFSDTCFQYYLDLNKEEYFWQDRFEPITIDNIFWLSVVPIYPDGVSIEYPWGWKTRPWHWMDDAVTFWLPGPFEPPVILDPIYNGITPLERLGDSYDATFELDTDPNYIKWEQPYTGLRHWDSYTDIYSNGGEYEGEVSIYAMAADDWLCKRRTPVSSIVWWGSYMGYMYMPCEPNVQPPVPPDYFLISVWTDVPVDDPCNIYDFSHPGRKVWEYKAYDYDEVMVGYDKQMPATGPLEPVFRYSVRLSEEDWFCQPDVNSIYWLGIVAVWDENEPWPDYSWGWTNHEHVFGDDGVQGWPGADPNIWSWQEIIDWPTGESRDLSFMLYTDPNICCECANFNLDTIVNFLDYAELANDWLWAGPAGGYATGDLNCDGNVDWYDVKIFVDQWLDSCP